jgi:phage-related minor tail protein
MAAKDIVIRFVGDAKPLADASAEAKSTLEKFTSAANVAGAAAGAAFGIGMAGAFEKDDALAKLKAQAGSATWAAAAGDAAGQLYQNAYGESMAETAELAKSVLVNGLVGPNATAEIIAGAAGQAQSIADAFGEEAGRVSLAAGQLLKTGMADTAEEALDVIAAGFQAGADKSGDLLDTFNEYGTQFRKLGIDGPTAIGLLTQGLQGGAHNADIVADALKEFSNRSLQSLGELGSNGKMVLSPVGQAFKDLGIDGAKAQAALAKGGVGASEALQEVQTKLRTVQDPADRAALAVTLFGTQAEDMADALFALNLGSAVEELGKVEGAAAGVDQAMGDTASATITSFTRQVKGELTDAVAGVIPYLRGAIDAVRPYVPVIVPLVAVLGGFAAAVWAVNAATKAYAATKIALTAVTKTWTAITLTARLAMLAMNAAILANPVGALIVAVIAVGAALVLAYKKSETFRNVVHAIGRTVASIAGNVIDWFGKIWGKIESVVSSVKSAFGTVADIILSPFKAAFNGIASAWNNTIGALSFGVPDWVPGIGGKGFDVPDMPMLAAGGVALRNRLHVVGERGPELFIPGQTGRVVPNGDSARMLGAAGGAPDLEVRVFIGDQELKGMVRTEVREVERGRRLAGSAGAMRVAPSWV